MIFFAAMPSVLMRSVPAVRPVDGDRLGDGGIQLEDHRRDALVEAGPRRRRRDAPCRAVEQPHAETGFELADGLAQGRGRQPEVFGSAREACPLDDGRKGLQLGKLRSAHYALLR